MEVIPAIDLLEGRCVRLYQGNYDQSEVFNENPVEVARRWADEGATRLHLVDLDGAKAGKPENSQAIEAIAAAVDVPIEVGGDCAIAIGSPRSLIWGSNTRFSGPLPSKILTWSML